MGELYGPNSHKYKEEQRLKAVEEEKKKIAKVATGKVTVKKKSEVRKFADNFINDEVANIKKYAIYEVIIPTIKDTIWSIFTNSLDMVLFGGDGGHKRSRSSSGGSNYVSYSSYSDRNRSRNYAEPRSGFSFDDIEFERRGDAEYVLDEMLSILEQYKIVSVSDFFELAGVDAPYTANKYGWTSLRTAEVLRVRNAYVIKLPKAMAID